jgi:sugar/nucleoside kinase (ribokinase family)
VNGVQLRGIVAKGIFVGLSTIDVVYNVKEFPSVNEKVIAESQELFVGGPATNAAVAFGHLGGKPELVTAVGRNILSSVLMDEFRRHSIQLIDLHPDFAQAPVVSSVSVNHAGDRNVVSANASRVTAPPARVDDAALKEAAVLMIDGHFIEACRAWSTAARAQGVHVVLDGGSWKEGTEELLRTVDTAICSADFKPPKCSTDDEVIAYLQAHGVLRIALTNGAEPVRFVSPSTSGILRVPQVEVVDTLGAGDFFHGAFCYYLSTGCGMLEALAEATKVASESCRYPGTREWLKHPL